jgi:CheY-like chemotaxis protein
MERRTGPRPQRVLIVDDSADIRALWRLWLTFWGFSVEEARNGLEAVNKAEAHPPDLILMDLWMPVLGGAAATEQLKRAPATANVPVLVMSAQGEDPDTQAVLAAGADVFMPKPCDPDVLLEHIRSAMKRLRPV